MRASRMAIALACLLLAGGAATTARAQELFVPAEWAGVWEFEITQWVCGQPEFPLSFGFTDTLCAGSAFESDSFCTGSVVGETAEMECSGSTVYGDCTEDYQIVQTMTRSGDAIDGTATMNLTYSGDCPEPDPVCLTMSLVATRIAGEPPECAPQPAQGVTWGTMKGLYR